ncbi:MAG: FAD/NAD(P)-binding protein [Legionellales bacterium]|nr:FAD/NAD(P)-binding protein [Legionellales bacterium]
MLKIAIIGGGPAGLSVCIQLMKNFIASNVKNIEIIVFEKNNKIGPGLPYKAHEPCHILNLPKEIMEPIFGETNKFSQWLNIKNPSMSTSFPSRYYFGEYLEAMANDAQIEAEINGLTITYLTDTEVFDIQENHTGIYQIVTSQSYYLADYTILCSGHMPSTQYNEFNDHPNFIHNPWDMHGYDKINPNKTIGIIGTRLTAIDVALKLRQMNHKGKMVMSSRSGLLPTVLGKEIPSYSLKYLNLETIKEKSQKNGGLISLNEIWMLLKLELQHADITSHLSCIPSSSLEIPPFQWINNEILEAESGARAWQQVLFALYPLTPNIWPMLSLADQDKFIKHYNSLFITYLAAFPLENAYKIRNMISSNLLEIHGQLARVSYKNQKFKMKFTNQDDIHLDYLINATGPGYDPSTISLYEKMLSQGLIMKHLFGGIDVVRETLQTLRKNGSVNPTLFALGELTKGTYFLTTDLGRVTEQAHKVSQFIAQSMITVKTSQMHYTIS